MNPYDRRHIQNVARYQKLIEAIYAKAAEEAAQIGASIRGIDPDRPFRFDDFPQTRKRVDALLRSLQSRLQVTIVNGIDAEWTLANNKNNELANRVFGDNVGRLSPAAYRRYYSTNDQARQAFQQRKINGLNLSDRVWRYTDQFKEEIEMGLDVGIRNGLSADQMTRDLRQYLRHPDKLFRRVRDERGQLHLSKAAAAFHPGRGVYRSSYMNARRLAATETNIAYRTSDHTRWQQMDFVVGIEVRLSPTNHTCKGSDGKPHPFEDICDELQGRYPKEFKFTGWHPHCRCHAVTILKTSKEIAEDTKRIMNGEQPSQTSVNEVRDVPPQFKKWLDANRERMEAAQARGTLPYFIKDNGNIVTRVLDGDMVIPQPVDILPQPLQAQPIQPPVQPPQQPVAPVDETKYRAPQVKASPMVEDFINAENKYQNIFEPLHNIITEWRNNQEYNDLLIQLIENSKYKGELFRAMNLSDEAFKKFRLDLVNHQEDATEILNRDLTVISWSKDRDTIMGFYGQGSAKEPNRVLIRTKEVAVRGYDHAQWAEDGNMDKEIMLTKYTKWRYVRSQKKFDEQGAYTEVWVEPASGKKRRK